MFLRTRSWITKFVILMKEGRSSALEGWKRSFSSRIHEKGCDRAEHVTDKGWDYIFFSGSFFEATWYSKPIKSSKFLQSLWAIRIEVAYSFLLSKNNKNPFLATVRGRKELCQEWRRFYWFTILDLFRNRRFRVMRSNKKTKIEDFGRVLSDPFMGFERTLLSQSNKVLP